jgi:hypothetical protein
MGIWSWKREQAAMPFQLQTFLWNRGAAVASSLEKTLFQDHKVGLILKIMKGNSPICSRTTKKIPLAIQTVLTFCRPQ